MVGRQLRDGCSHCIVTQKCHCSIMSNEQYFGPKLVTCANSNQTSNQKHAVNLPALLWFKEVNKKLDITAATLLNYKPSVRLPPIFNSDLPWDTSTGPVKMSLQEVARAVHNQENDFLEIANRLNLPGVSSNNILGMPSRLIWILSGVGITVLTPIIGILIFVFFKNNKLATLLLAIKSPSSTTAAMYDTYIEWGPTKSVKIPTSNDEFSFICSDDIALLLIASIALGLFFCFLWFLYKIFRKPYFNLTFASNAKCMTIPLYSAPVSPQNFHIISGRNIRNINLTGRITPVLSWDDPPITLINLLDKKACLLPCKISLTWIQAYYLNRLLKTPFSVYITATHGLKEYVFPICDPRCPLCSEVFTQRSVSDRDPLLYPPLPTFAENDTSATP